MKAGCYFCPVSSDHPKAYIKDLMKRLHLRAFFLMEDTVTKLQNLNSDNIPELIQLQEGLTFAIICHNLPDKKFHGLAYCITTSGTTGEPKIVKVPDSCIVPNISNIRYVGLGYLNFGFFFLK